MHKGQILLFSLFSFRAFVIKFIVCVPIFLTVHLIFVSCVSNANVSNPVSGAFIVRQLSDYCPSLKNSPGDTAVYVLDSGKPGARMLLVAGTHGNEIGGIRAAEFIAEHVLVERGCIFVIPRLNAPGVKAGSRLVPPEDQGQPDPDLYTPPEGSSVYTGTEQRNIDRSYPGTEYGGTAQIIALAVMRLLVSENIEIAIDLHEASPSSPMAWNIVANPKNVQAAALAVFDLEEKGISMNLEESAPKMDGLSHKEWGDRTQAMSFLIETANPAQADYPSADEENDSRYALSRRIAIQLETIRLLVARCNEALSAPLVFSGIPEYAEQDDHTQGR